MLVCALLLPTLCSIERRRALHAPETTLKTFLVVMRLASCLATQQQKQQSSLQYFITQYPDGMDDNDIEELSKVIGDKEDCCPHCGWRGFFLACDVCGREEVDIDLFAAEKILTIATEVEYENEELVTADIPEKDDFDTMPLFFDIEDRMAEHMLVELTSGDVTKCFHL